MDCSLTRGQGADLPATPRRLRPHRNAHWPVTIGTIVEYENGCSRIVGKNRILVHILNLYDSSHRFTRPGKCERTPGTTDRVYSECVCGHHYSVPGYAGSDVCS